MVAKKSRVIQVPMSEKLLYGIDEASKGREQSRSAFIREACVRYLDAFEKEKLVEQYERGYERVPEGEEEEAWAKVGEERLADLLAEDSW